MDLIYIDPYTISPPDPDALAYIARVEGINGDNQTLEPDVKQAIFDFVVGCKTDGIWDSIKSSCILAGARTLNGALQPLAGTAPTSFNFVSGDYNRKTGLKGDGVSKYLDSNRLSSDDPQDDIHFSLYLSDPGSLGVEAALMHTEVAAFSEDANGAIKSSGDALIIRNRRGFSLTAGSLTASSKGLIGSSRSTSSAYSLALLGTFVNNVPGASYTPAASSYFVFARNQSGADLHADSRLAFYSIGESLDLTALDARVEALIAAIGAAIP